MNNSTLFVYDVEGADLYPYYKADDDIFKRLGGELVDILLPLCLLCGKSRREIIDVCTPSCIEIAYLASELNLIIKARPHSPVTFYSPVRGDIVSPDNAHLFGDDREMHGEVQITLMLGIKPAGNLSVNVMSLHELSL
ncbi:hypothetical protein OCU04_003222 [Sclerotinia nivalis]|uniref:Uncharacterized protein n=1 Tax=Sclerotinia nivalis TaxID=352851 RepID=A0A9X0ARH9_9HELO|nr:hypothetical protein OCU04_003222 [Sclerotinia nivalis]